MTVFFAAGDDARSALGPVVPKWQVFGLNDQACSASGITVDLPMTACFVLCICRRTLQKSRWRRKFCHAFTVSNRSCKMRDQERVGQPTLRDGRWVPGFESWLTFSTWNEALEREASNDQDNRCFGFCLSHRFTDAGNATIANSVGEHGHASRRRLWAGQDEGEWCLRVQNRETPQPSRRTQMRAMEWERLRSIPVKRPKPAPETYS